MTGTPKIKGIEKHQAYTQREEQQTNYDCSLVLPNLLDPILLEHRLQLFIVWFLNLHSGPMWLSEVGRVAALRKGVPPQSYPTSRFFLHFSQNIVTFVFVELEREIRQRALSLDQRHKREGAADQILVRTRSEIIERQKAQFP